MSRVYQEEIDPTLLVEERQVGAIAGQKYVLIEHKATAKSKSPRGLVLVLPGGPGGKEFLPFCANVLTRWGIPTDFMAAQLIAPVWDTREDRVVWPGKAFPDPKAKFTSEAFLEAVREDVCKRRTIDPRYIFTLGWSSSGHVLYSASVSNEKVRGSLIAMSRFLPEKMLDLKRVRGKSYFLYHSPDDTTCPFADVQAAEKALKENGARVKLVTYPGGHGWVVNTFYADRIREGLLWLKEQK
jgi:predicted esterase